METTEVVVYLCSEGRPWEPDGNGGFRRIDYDEAQRRIQAGAMKQRKPYEHSKGF
jgi:hypothetical protein